MKPLVWIASYPKSGNTWMRLALTSLLNGGGAVDINTFKRSGDASSFSRMIFDDLLGVESSELTEEEILAARPAAFRLWAAEGGGPYLLKVHEAYVDTPKGEPLFPADVSRAAVHIVRDPRDVAVSAVRLYGKDIDAVITRMAKPDHVQAANSYQLNMTLPQPLSSWSGHAESWMDRPDFPVLTLRYEDMLTDMAAALRRAAEVIDIAVDDTAIAGAVAATRFDALRRQEAEKGFRENSSPSAAPFFRRGVAGGWRDDLTPDQADRIVADHGPMMERLGYL
jgi:aryl sulfotransferase